MFEHFAIRHLPPLFISTALMFGGLMPFVYGPEAAATKFGFREDIASNKAAWPVMKVYASRATHMGLTLWVLYLAGYLEAMDIMFATFGWAAVVDGLVCLDHGRPGTATFRTTSTGAVAIWGALGMTSGKFF